MLLVGKADIDKGSHSLDGGVVLGAVDKVANAGLEMVVPVENVKVGVLRALSAVCLLSA